MLVLRLFTSYIIISEYPYQHNELPSTANSQRLEFYQLRVSLQQMVQQQSILFDHIYSSWSGLP